MQYYKNRYDASYIEEDKNIYNFITCAADIMDMSQNETILKLNKDKFVDFALHHPEKNMIDLFKHFNYPVPETEIEKNDPRYQIHLLYKRDSKGNLVPRENIFFYEKYVENYQNPFNASYTILEDYSIIDNRNLEALSDQKMADKMKKSKQKEILNMQKKIGRRTISSNLNIVNGNEDSIRKLQYKLCMQHYEEKFKKDIKDISIDEISSLGDIYYIIKTSQSDNVNDPFETINLKRNNNNIKDSMDFNLKFSDFFDEEEEKDKFIEKLIKNNNSAENNFGCFSIKPKESQFLLDCFKGMNINPSQKSQPNNIKTESQELLQNFNELKIKHNRNNPNDSKIGINISKDILNESKHSDKSLHDYYADNLLYDENRLLLMMKGRRIDFIDYKGQKYINHFFYDFYFENKILNTVQVAYNVNVAKIDKKKFKEKMQKINMNEEIIMVFAYNAAQYFNIKNLMKDFTKRGVESVYYIDSSKENPKVAEIYEEINK